MMIMTTTVMMEAAMDTMHNANENIEVTKPFNNHMIKLLYWVKKKFNPLKSQLSRNFRAGIISTCMKPWAMHSTGRGVKLASTDKGARTGT